MSRDFLWKYALVTSVLGACETGFDRSGSSIEAPPATPRSDAEETTTTDDAGAPTDAFPLAADDAGVSSADAPPSIQLVLPASLSALCGLVLVEASASDDVGVASVSLSVGASNLGMTTSPPYRFQWNTSGFANGAHELSLVATDTAGQRTEVRASVMVDNASGGCDNAPVVSITEPAAGLTNAETITIRATATDDVGVVSVSFFVDSGRISEDTTAPYSAVFVAADFGDGTHVIKAVAADTSGQMSEHRLSITIDRTRPVLAITKPQPGSVAASRDLDVSASASDPNGISLVVFEVDGRVSGSLASPPWAHRLTGLTSGSRVLTARARDGAGNETSATAMFVVDLPPSIGIASPASLRGNVTVTATASDDIGVSRVELFVDGTSIGARTSRPFEAVWNTAGSATGNHTLEAMATDSRGQTARASRTVVLVDDPPVVTLTSPSSGATVRGTVSVSGEVRDDIGLASAQLLLDGIPLLSLVGGPFTASWDTLQSPLGSHTLEVRATDNRNQTRTAQAALIVADAPPTVTWSSPQASADVSGTVTLEVTASDDLGVARVEFWSGSSQIAVDTSAPYSAAWNASGQTPGSHTLEARVFDSRGQSSTASRTVTAGDPPPQVTITSPADGAAVSGRITITVNATDNDAIRSVRFDVEGRVVDDRTAPYAVTWDTCSDSDGLVTVSAVATDSRNQTGSAQIQLTVANNAVPATLSGASSFSRGAAAQLSWTLGCASSAPSQFLLYWSAAPGVSRSSNRIQIDGARRGFLHAGRTFGSSTYYRVAAIYGGTEGPLSSEVSVRPSLGTEWEGEPNNTSITSDSLNGPRAVRGSMEVGEDWYEITVPTVPTGGSIYAGVTNPQGDCSTVPSQNFSLSLFNAFGTRLGTSTGGGGRTGVCAAIDPANHIWATGLGGTYYVRLASTLSEFDYRMVVGANSPTCGDYVVDASSETCDDGNSMSGDGCSAACEWEGQNDEEPNDTVGEATLITASTSVLVQGDVWALDEDFFAIDVPLSGHLDLQLMERGYLSCDPYANLALEVIDRDGTTVLGRSEQASGSTACPYFSGTIGPLAAGRYYVRLTADKSILYFLQMTLIHPV